MLGQAERLLELRRMQEDPGINRSKKIFAFTSGKGGTGKTFLSLNLACSLAEEGKKVLFIDLDSNMSNANIMMNIVSTKTIYDFYSEKKLLKDLITTFNKNLHFIFGDSGKINYPDIHGGIISKLFTQLKSLQHLYDFIFLDTGSGAGDSIINILMKTDFVFLITTPEPTSIMDSYVMLKLLNTGGFNGDKIVIINKTIDKDDGKSAFNNLSTAAGHFLKEELFYQGNVQFDMTASKSIIDQELLVKTYPDSDTAKQIRAIGEGIIEFVHMANILHPLQK